jgi:hypothetical protein
MRRMRDRAPVRPARVRRALRVRKTGRDEAADLAARLQYKRDTGATSIDGQPCACKPCAARW